MMQRLENLWRPGDDFTVLYGDLPNGTRVLAFQGDNGACVTLPVDRWLEIVAELSPPMNLMLAKRCLIAQGYKVCKQSRLAVMFGKADL